MLKIRFLSTVSVQVIEVLIHVSSHVDLSPVENDRFRLIMNTVTVCHRIDI